ncbi:MAG: YqgE/AlgH family protein [Venatoribacter sp.]
MQQLSSLKNHLLVAMPKLRGSEFASAVVYLCEYGEEGAMGLMLNKPLPIQFQDICKQLNIVKLDTVNPQILSGGPVNTENGFVLHKEEGPWRSTMCVREDVHLSTSKDVLEAIAANAGPRFYRMALGYSGWSAGQLEEELRDNSWLTIEATPELLFETLPEHLYQQALAKIGVSMQALGGDAGHA